jgi:choloylglycine hydrolase
MLIIFLRLIYLIFLVSIASVFACTEFVLVDGMQQSVVARTLEFGPDLQSEIRNFPRGTKFTSYIMDEKVGMQWSATYGFLGVMAYQSFMIDGFNEAGLSVAYLWFPGTIYKEVTLQQNSKTIAFEDFPFWILGSFSSVDEIKKVLASVQIWFHPLEQFKGVPPVHISIHDKQGKSIVIEYINGRMEVFDNPIKVVTNAPEFSWHLTNLRNYLNLSALNKGSISMDGFSLSPIGQGSGFVGLPGDWTPPSRFVRIALFKNFVKQAKDREENVNLAFHLLNTVDIPYGVIQSVDGSNPDYTQWIVVKDLQGGQFYYRTYGNLNINVLNISQMTSPLSKVERIPMHGAGTKEKALNR